MLQVVNFCDNDVTDPHNLHNREAPNKHNRLCDSRSAWEVMREHEDFKGIHPSQFYHLFALMLLFVFMYTRHGNCGGSGIQEQ